MHPLLSKSARVGALYVALCALALWLSRRDLLALCTDSRDATIRELVLDPRDADVLFLGSSQTARGLIPAAFDERYSELTGKAERSVNLAPFGAGRHIGFLELARWLESHRPPEVVVVEVGITSDVVDYMHKMLPRFMDLRDARRVLRYRPYSYRDAVERKRRELDPPRIDPRGVFTALDRFAMHFELALDVLGRGPEDCMRGAFNAAIEHGRAPYWKPGEDLLAEVVAQSTERGYCRVTPDSPLGVAGRKDVAKRAAQISYEDSLRQIGDADTDAFADPRRSYVARLYAQQIAASCREHGSRLVFLEQPNFRGRPLSPSQVDFYRSIAELIVLDKTVLFREESFQDAGHMSVQGAEYASRALAEQLATSARDAHK